MRVTNLLDKLRLLPVSLPAGPADGNITVTSAQVNRCDQVDVRRREDKSAISGFAQCQFALALEATVR